MTASTDDCRAIFARLSEFLDEELDPTLCERIRNHVETCATCHGSLESLRRTVALTRRLQPRELPEPLRRELREHYEKLRNAGGE